ncbi:C39 family peptidase [Bacillus sp. DX1.1]|uniref:C39 family peptidase n=1 Tax=unclassified Bacillus (in: firmicutes) TaxID=185979 RepID=UPI0025706916|nr:MULTISPECIES: C39 family peptidase [unclassified Bacillus (in: firmicutes)]MDM5153484.1 C39 family peptidase [Bacillus sp. DX1.1]WJE82439.1 C39 family peptidase [Bacillus sp. DX3.1]
MFRKVKYICILGIVIVVGVACSKDAMGVVAAGKNKIFQKTQELRVDFLFDMKETAMIENVPFIKQLPELPRGCEVTSLAMLLQYKDVQVDKMKLASEINRVPFKENNLRGNPHEGFVGNIYTKSEPGYGVYHEPIFELAERYVPEKTIDLTGRDIEDIYKVISSGSPVWVIANTTFQSLAEDSFETWNTNAGDLKITYYEHSAIIVGYDQNFVYINDPLANKPNKKVSRAQFEKAWEQMGKQAITIL